MPHFEVIDLVKAMLTLSFILEKLCILLRIQFPVDLAYSCTREFKNTCILLKSNFPSKITTNVIELKIMTMMNVITPGDLALLL